MSGFQEILTTNSPERRRGLWQQAFARLIQDGLLELPGALDALPPGTLEACVSQALREGWLGAPERVPLLGEALAWQALELALPPGACRQELTARNRRALLEGPADVFAALTERYTLSHAPDHEVSAEEDPGYRARVLLCLLLTPRQCPHAGGLALAMLSRPSVAHRWLAEAAHQSLPQRRAAARLLERGARGAVGKNPGASNDGWARRILASEAVELALPRLLGDREPLVWHHAALARGLLATHHEPFQQAILAGLDAERSPTEWRRAGTSLVAWIGRDPSAMLPLLDREIRGGLLRRQQGLGGVLVRALGVTAECNPEAAVEVFGWLLRDDPLGAAEALSDAMEQGFSPAPAQLQRALALLQEAATRAGPRSLPDDGLDALWAARHGELLHGHEGTALGVIDDALAAYASSGPAEALPLAREAVHQVEASIALLALLDEASGDSDDEIEVRRRLFSVLHNVQRSALQDDRLDALLDLDAALSVDDSDRLVASRDWLVEWLLLLSPAPHRHGTPLPHQSLHVQKLRTLLYAADAHTRAATPASLAGAYRRRQRIAAAMFARLRAGVPAPLERATCATLARSLDALLRVRDLVSTDVLLLALREGLEADALRVLIEASANLEVELLLGAYLAAFRTHLDPGSPSTLAPPSIPPTIRAPGQDPGAPGDAAPSSMAAYHFFGERLRRLRELAQQIASESSSRADACKRALLGYAEALQGLLGATSMRETIQGEAGMVLLERSWFELLQQIASAEQRAGLRTEPLALPRPAVPALRRAIDQQDPGEVERTLNAVQIDLERTLPSALASLASPIVGSLLALPLLPRGRAAGPRPLLFPPWVPDNRILGAFRLLAPAGSGGAGSVFIAQRTEDRDSAGAERFALKVPEYSDVAAQTLTEEQFFQLFREEASALLNLPHHPNLARFVTFDLAARPKPILVMELVEGLSLDQILTAGPLDRPRALAILDGVLAGLEAMHATGIGHLDIKPQNVILRGGEVPVLVDFGLSGRTLRPGCGSLAYSAPEIWLGSTEGVPVSPSATDVYAVACLAFELLVGEPLFPATSEVAAIATHLAHDGWPPGLQARRGALGPLATTLHDALRRSPSGRLSAAQLRQHLRAHR